MQIKELNDMVDSLVNLRKIKDEIVDKIAEKKAKFEMSILNDVDAMNKAMAEVRATQEKILAVLNSENLNQWKTEKATVSKRKSVSFKVVDIVAVSKKLKRMKLFDEYISVSLKPIAKTFLERQENFPGVEKEEKEYISVLNAKK